VGIQITPSILNADFANLGAEVARIGNADWVHVDVMDNHFVPNLTFGPAMVEALARSTDVPLDAHLMIEDADRNALAYVEAGCGSVTFHVEAARAPVRLARELRAHGARASMALKPATPIEPYEDLLPELDMVLLMTVEPGFGGQKFLDLCLPKIRRARQLMDKHGVETWLQVDGGISLATIERCAEAGADVFVAGSAVYSADDPERGPLWADSPAPPGAGCGKLAPTSSTTRVLWGRCNSEPAVKVRDPVVANDRLTR
jgi:ribulose-phosphate 3-epimerase